MTTKPETEPTEDEVKKWQAELDADRRAADRTVTAAVKGRFGMPIVFCRDGTCFEMIYLPMGKDGVQRWTWEALPPIPDSPAALSGDYNGRALHEPMFGSDDAAKPFLAEDED